MRKELTVDNYAMLGNIIAMLTGMPRYWGLLLDVVTKMTDPQFACELAKCARREPCWIVETGNAAGRVVRSILRCLSDSAPAIVIGVTSGERTIASATDVFTWGIDSDFKNWGLDVPGEAKPETPIQVYEMVQDGDFRTIYGGAGRDLDELCFTQEQIIRFVREHKKWLRTGGYATFFLFKVGTEFFVARVDLDDDAGPSANVYRFSGGNVWRAVNRLRLVLPQALES